jgi:hypothetical protein
VPNKLVTPHSEQLRRPSTGHLALPIELKDDQLPSGLLRGSLELLEELDEVLIELDGNGFHVRLCEQIVHPVTARGAYSYRPAADHPRIAATAPLTPLAAHQNNTTAAPPGALSSAAWGGTQTREQCSPLATERTHRSTCTPRPAPVATCRDKSLKNRGFQTPRADDQGGALRRLQSRAAGDEGGVGRATPAATPRRRSRARSDGGRSVPFDQRIRLKDCALW